MPGKKSDSIKAAEERAKRILQKNIVELRKMHGLTQQAVADALGIKRETYSNYECRTLPPQFLIMSLAKIYNISPDQFYRTDLTVSSRIVLRSNDSFYGENNFTDLTDTEKLFVMNFRQLTRADKEELVKYMNKMLGKE